MTVLTACATPPVSETEIGHVDRLLTVVASRFELTTRLAEARWNARLGIDEPLRERSSIDAAIARSQEFALPPEVVQDVLQAQIDAGKIVQETLRAQWNAERRSPTGLPDDAGASVWRELDANARRLFEELARAYPILRREGGRGVLERRAKAIMATAPGGARAATTALAPLWQLGQ